MIFSKNNVVKGMDIYDKPVEGKIDGFVGSFGLATIRIDGCCYGTTVNLTNGSINKIEEHE